MKEFDSIQAVDNAATLIVNYNKIAKPLRLAYAFNAMRQLKRYEKQAQLLVLPDGQERIKELLISVFVESAAYFTLITRGSKDIAIQASQIRIMRTAKALRDEVSKWL